MGALVNQDVRRLIIKNGEVVKEEIMFSEIDARIRDVRANAAGHIYVLTDSGQGKIIRIVPDNNTE